MDLLLSFFIKDLWIFRLFFAVYIVIIFIKLVKLVISDLEKKTKRTILIQQLIFVLLVFLPPILQPIMTGVSIVMILTYIVVRSENRSFYNKLPLVGDIALAATHLSEHYEKNSDLAFKHFDSKGLQKMTVFTKDPQLKKWRKEIKNIISNHTSKILKSAIAINVLLGIVFYVLNPDFIIGFEKASQGIGKQILIHGFGIFFAVIWGICLGLFAALFVSGMLGDFVAMFFKLSHKYPNLLKYY